MGRTDLNKMREKQVKEATKWHRKEKARLLLQGIKNFIRLSSFLSRARKTVRYLPHQGPGEIARRKRQIDRGIPKVENGLVRS